MATLREATSADTVGLATVHVESWRAAYRGCLPDDYLDGLAVDDRLPSWAARMQARADAVGDAEGPPAREHLLVVEDGGEVVGFASGGPVAPEVGEVHSLYLLPEAWGRGLGRALLHELVDRLRSDGYRSLVLWVMTSNERARQFYERNGWTTDDRGQRDLIWGVEIDSTQYALDLHHRSGAAF